MGMKPPMSGVAVENPTGQPSRPRCLDWVAGRCWRAGTDSRHSLSDEAAATTRFRRGEHIDMLARNLPYLELLTTDGGRVAQLTAQAWHTQDTIRDRVPDKGGANAAISVIARFDVSQLVQAQFHLHYWQCYRTWKCLAAYRVRSASDCIYRSGLVIGLCQMCKVRMKTNLGRKPKSYSPLEAYNL